MRLNSHWRLWLALLLITLLGGVLRFYALVRLPPGLHYDEAFNNLMALRLVHGTMPHPIYFQVEFGEEPLHIYLISFLFRLFGPTFLGGRMISALAGTWTVLALALTVREIFYARLGRLRATRLGLLTGLLMTAFYWPMHYSRIGMEPTMTPALLVPAFGLTWRALRTRRMRDAVLGGIFLGGTLYTYPASRFAPVVLAVFFGLWVLFQRGFLRANWRTLLLVAGVALIVFAPLGYFFLKNPFWFTYRASMVEEQTYPELKQELINIARGFFHQGDINWRQNLSKRPIFDPLQSVLFITGVLTCLVLHAPAYLFLLVWMVVMLIPGAITEYAPHFGRMLSAAPAAVALMAVGVTTWYELVMTWTAKMRPIGRKMVSGAIVVILCAMMLLSGLHSVYDYFVVWGRADALFIAFDSGLRWVGEQIQAIPEDERIFLTPIARDHPTLAFLVNDREERIHAFNGRRCYVYPPRLEHPASFFIFVDEAEDPRSLSRYRAVFPRGRVAAQIQWKGEPYAVRYQVPAGSVAQTGPGYRRPVHFGSGVDLLGYDAPEGPMTPGSPLKIRLYWQSYSPINQSYKTFVHLWGTPAPMEGGRIWGQEDTYPCDNSYPHSHWMPGDVLVEERYIPISPEAPPGDYQIAVGLYVENGPRLPVLDDAGNAVGDYVIVTPVQIKAP